MDMKEVSAAARQALTELLDAAHLEPGSIVVVGCSSSEILGEKIGTASSMDAAEAVLQGLLPLLRQRGLYLAAQCCEHLNRVLIVEKALVQREHLTRVNVVPQPKAGGSFATAVFRAMEAPAAVEAIQADAGMDIGSTLIGMHLKPVAVPVRASLDHIGCAPVVMARTRYKYVGGPRAQYEQSLM